MADKQLKPVADEKRMNPAGKKHVQASVTITKPAPIETNSLKINDSGQPQTGKGPFRMVTGSARIDY